MVCEVANTLKGILPGDLGDIGCASLYQEQINILFNLVACEKDITYLFHENSAVFSIMIGL